ncbi:MAG: cation diffusion facilitator family transporter [Acidobacteriota bacterium]|jgi:cobalt-zinc-cadmium efflux system protein|nr:cation transporter [Acidobacteriota bacterium]MDQ3374127.1 cation diffusion facilitator family transporter [Acidobacteriota bacterium]
MTRLKIALGLTAVYMFAEAFGGWLTNSLALLADAGHMLTDVGALTLTLAAIWFAARPATSGKTYGYYRLEILAAFVNGIALVLICLWVIYEAVERWSTPPEVKGFELILIASGGLLVNLFAAWLLHSGHQHDLNMRGAFLHVVGDALGSVTAIAAGVAITFFGWLWADAVGSVLISLIIIFGAWRLIRESVNVLLEGTPSHINLTAVEQTILQTKNVENVHDLHVWTITSGMEALSVHIVHRENVVQAALLREIRTKLHDEFGIDHLTIQMETSQAGNPHECFSSANCFEPAPNI